MRRPSTRSVSRMKVMDSAAASIHSCLPNAAPAVASPAAARPFQDVRTLVSVPGRTRSARRSSRARRARSIASAESGSWA